ncbi:MAG: glycosyltransferase [Leptolyngbyaceae cyanobacterium MO_188.B28]|nr:glycosyltransferase [Leptolyngbyaceae cyanobacterium MO_188.B28]
MSDNKVLGSSEIRIPSSPNERGDCERTIMLFDLSVRGHHPSYIQHLIDYWCKQMLPGCLQIVVSSRFPEEHGDVVEFGLTQGKGRVKFTAITPQEEAALGARKSKIKRALRTFQEWGLFQRYAKTLKADHCLFMYFDTCQWPLTLGAQSPCSFSGIYFRPTFHYPQFAGYAPSRKDRLQQLQEKLFLFAIRRQSRLKTLFSLDPFAVKHLEKGSRTMKAVHLPDPIQLNSALDEPVGNIQDQLAIEPGRRVFLLFGALTGRKGVPQLLDAIATLDPNLCQKLCLLLVGESNIAEALEARIKLICQERPVQIVRQYEFVAEETVPAYFQLSDVILAPYQRHVGMSGILLWAAAAQKPVLSSDYGLMGEIVRRHQLGVTVDSTRPDEIAKGLTYFLTEAGEAACDRTKMKAFAKANSADRFAEVIFQNL